MPKPAGKWISPEKMAEAREALDRAEAAAQANSGEQSQQVWRPRHPNTNSDEFA